MKDRIYDSLRQGSQRWVSWTKQHAKELGDAALRHVERQDLLTERQRILLKIGEFVVERLVVDQRKSISATAGDLQQLFARLAEIEHRLRALESADTDSTAVESRDHSIDSERSPDS